MSFEAEYLEQLKQDSAGILNSLPEPFHSIGQRFIDLAYEYQGDPKEGHYRARIGLEAIAKWSVEHPDSAVEMSESLCDKMRQQQEIN